MKRILSIIILAFISIGALLAAEKLTGLMLTFKDETREAMTELFANNPVLSHKDDGRTIVITVGTDEILSVPASEVKEMTFCEIKDTPTGVSQIVTPKGEHFSVYSLDGRNVDLHTTKGIVVINGRKVLVR